MPTIKLAVLRSTRAKDGTYKIRIAIGHKSETHYIVTRYSVPSLTNWRNGSIINTPTAHHDNLKLRQLLTDYEDRLERIPNPSELSPVQLRDTLQRMQSQTQAHTLNEVFESTKEHMISEGRKILIISFAQKSVIEHLHGDIFLSNITPATIADLVRDFRSRHLANTSINTIMQHLQRVINIAVRDGLVRYDIHPFAYYHPLPHSFRDIDLSIDDFRKIATLDTDNRHFIIARDALLLSYFLGGINLVDLLQIDFRQANGLLDYTRQKTKTTSATRIQISIHPRAQELINRYIGTDGHIHFGNMTSYKGTSMTINTYIKEVAESLHIPKAAQLTYYTARKSFVQHAFDLGINLEVIEYCVGHSSQTRRTIYNYMRVMRRHADEAISRIIGEIFP